MSAKTILMFVLIQGLLTGKKVCTTDVELSLLAERPTRIVGGIEAKMGQHSWQVSVQWGDEDRGIKQRHVCGGSLLTAGWVLTAGHCKTLAPHNSTARFLIVAGKYRLGIMEETEQHRYVTQSFLYYGYTGKIGPKDIALMKVERAFELNAFVATVGLPYPETIPRGDAMLTGWGSIGRSRAPEIPVILQEAVLPILDFEVCQRALDRAVRHESSNPLHETNICTGPLDGSKSACKGDSGGPLVVTNLFGAAEVIGIVSWGLFPCGGRGAPSVYTRVSAYVTWIHKIMLNH